MESIREIIRSVYDARKELNNAFSVPESSFNGGVCDIAEAQIELLILKEKVAEYQKGFQQGYSYGLDIGDTQGRHEAANEERRRLHAADTAFAKNYSAPACIEERYEGHETP